jgi:hypothetical protein
MYDLHVMYLNSIVIFVWIPFFHFHPSILGRQFLKGSWIPTLNSIHACKYFLHVFLNQARYLNLSSPSKDLM